MHNHPSLEEVGRILDKVSDPEIPVLSIRDLGILRSYQWLSDGMLEVVITPTYSGCPAMNAIEVNIRAVLEDHDIRNVQVKTQLSPAWTTDWLTDEGRVKLEKFGIAPPAESSLDKKALLGQSQVIACPFCGSKRTEMIAQFGSTSCKALFKCLDCLEPFDYFKCH
jgi:ring-1,2-phenylacetyl-CoA epoxidase subunit PaaD